MRLDDGSPATATTVVGHVREQSAGREGRKRSPGTFGYFWDDDRAAEGTTSCTATSVGGTTILETNVDYHRKDGTTVDRAVHVGC
jgi:hypothetical protein